MKNIYLDIETIPGQAPAIREDIAAGITPPGNISKAETIAAWEKEKKPGLIEEAWRKTSFDGALGQIVVIGYAVDGHEPRTLFDAKDCLTLGSEAQLLKKFFAELEKMDSAAKSTVCWVGHNIIDFDFRFLFQRAVIHGIKPPFWIPFDSKPWGDRVFDTMTAWAGVRGRVGQDKLCRALGIAGKGTELGDEIDGSKVWDFVKAGRIADVATYCGGDVSRARELHQRLTFQAAA